jgi:hypothetical protein
MDEQHDTPDVFRVAQYIPATVTLETGKASTIMVPAADQSAAQAQAQALAAYQVFAAAQQSANVDVWLEKLETTGVFDILARFTRRMVYASITVKPTDGAPPSPAGRAAVQRELGRLVRVGLQDPAERRKFAAYVATHISGWVALRLADELAAEGRTREETPSEEYDRRFRAIWQSDGYLADALQQCTVLYAQQLTRVIVSATSSLPAVQDALTDIFARAARRMARWSPPIPPPVMEPEPRAPARDRQAGPDRPRGGVLTALPPYTRFPADRIHMGTVEAFARIHEWKESDDFHRALTVASGPQFHQTVGLRSDPGEQIWNVLRESERMILGHYALWARCYETTGGDPSQYVILSVPQFCADLDYKKHHKGGFRLRDKREAMQLLEALTTPEIAVEFVTPGRAGKVLRLRGRIWERGLEAEQRDQYSDLFGSARSGDRNLWEPIGFSYRPGPWFADSEWRRYNRFVGMIGAGLLKLHTRNDRWAIRIGGYYGTLARIGQYRSRTIAVAKVLEKTGLMVVNARNPAEQEEAFSRAHDRLVQVGVLLAWMYEENASGPVDEEPDMDDPETLATLHAYGAGDWRRKRVRLEWPAAMTMAGESLSAAQERAIQRAKRRLPPP